MKKHLKTLVKKPAAPVANNNTDHSVVGHGRNVNDGRSMKVAEQVIDGGNMEDRDDPLANEESPVLVQNIADTNLSIEKKRR